MVTSSIDDKTGNRKLSEDYAIEIKVIYVDLPEITTNMNKMTTLLYILINLKPPNKTSTRISQNDYTNNIVTSPISFN